MERKYLMIIAAQCITSCSKFFIVYCSETERGRRDYNFLKDYALKKNYYFHLYDVHVTEFLGKIAESLAMRVYQLPIMQIKARCLVKTIKEHHDAPKSNEIGREAANFQLQIDPACYTNYKISVIQRAEADKRHKPKSSAKRKQGNFTL